MKETYLICVLTTLSTTVTIINKVSMAVMWFFVGNFLINFVLQPYINYRTMRVECSVMRVECSVMRVECSVMTVECSVKHDMTL